MDIILRGVYDGALAVARALAVVTPPSTNKLLRSFAARRGVRARFQNWAALNRDRRRPLLWMHAPSVGEGLQARAIMDLVRARRPDVQILFTFYSPSAEEFALSLDADYCDYLPFDSAGDARATITAVAPTAFVYSKLDLWPNFTRAASLRGIRLGMTSATVSPGSGRSGFWSRKLLREGYSRLDAVGAVSEEDASRIISLGARPEVVFVTGDTRNDQVMQRAAETDRRGELLAPLAAPHPTIVAGSTWPADEEHLLAAFVRLRAKFPDARLIIAPHEPNTSHIVPLERWGATNSISCARLSSPDAPQSSIIIVDRVGVLSQLYALADVAFVGGGFHEAGLHSVLEPAAFCAPVLFGPLFRNSRDALQLIRARGGSSVRDADELHASLVTLLSDNDLRNDAGAAARRTVEEGAGAAERSYHLVDALLSS